MTIQELINYLETLDNKDREVFLYSGGQGSTEDILTEDSIDDSISDRLDINIEK